MICSRMSLTLALAVMVSSAWAERLPTADEVARIRAAQPLPTQETLDAVKGQNSDNTSRALSRAQRQSKTTPQGGLPTASGLPAINATEGVDIKSLVEKHYKNNQRTFDGQPSQKSAPGLLYFASFSVSDASLERAIDQAERCGAALVIRGLVKGGDFRATVERIAKLLNRRKVSFLIDPTLFSRFDIQRVPTVVLVASGEVPRCEDQDCTSPAPLHWAVAGDVTLDYALEEIVRQAPESETVAQPYLTALHRGFHDGR